jgi:hypothetical protein
MADLQHTNKILLASTYRVYHDWLPMGYATGTLVVLLGTYGIFYLKHAHLSLTTPVPTANYL